MKTVRLYGELGKKYGRVHRLAVKTPAEAVRALCANHKGLDKDLLGSKDRGVGYRVFSDKENIGEEDLKKPVSKEIKIVPVIVGAGGPGFKVIFGAVLIAAGLAINILSGGSLAWLGTPMIHVGVAFVAGGVYQMLVPVPKSPQPPEAPNNMPSYNFNGPVNTSAQGQPVPICYGRLIVGGGVVSAGIAVSQLKGPPAVTGNYSNFS